MSSWQQCWDFYLYGVVAQLRQALQALQKSLHIRNIRICAADGTRCRDIGVVAVRVCRHGVLLAQLKLLKFFWLQDFFGSFVTLCDAVSAVLLILLHLLLLLPLYFQLPSVALLTYNCMHSYICVCHSQPLVVLRKACCNCPTIATAAEHGKIVRTVRVCCGASICSMPQKLSSWWQRSTTVGGGALFAHTRTSWLHMPNTSLLVTTELVEGPAHCSNIFWMAL